MEKLPISLMNAAGWAKTIPHVRQLAKVSVIDYIVAGSFTVERREGNTGGTNFYVADDGTSVNSLGLPNGGRAYLEAYGEEMCATAKQAGKKLVINIAGFSPKDYYVLSQVVALFDCVVEVNVGCPNVYQGGKQKDIASFCLPMLREIVDTMDTELKGKEWWLKLSPTSNPKDREHIAEAIGQSSCGVVMGNTFPNVSLYRRDGKPALDVADNYAGMAGTALRPINLSQCRHYRDLMPDRKIIGAGGINSGRTLRQYEVVGSCAGGQVGTAFFLGENFRIFEEIAASYIDIVNPESCSEAAP